MKKFLVSLLIILVVTTGSVFAISGHGSFKMGPTFDWSTVKTTIGNTTRKNQIDTIGLMIDIEGATYFTNTQHQFGIGYGLGFSIPLSQKMDGNEVSDLSPVTIIPEVTFQYRYVMDPKFAIEAGAGFGVFTESETNNNTKYSFTNVGLVANAGIQYKFTNLIGLRAGLDIAIPFNGTLTMKSGNTTTKTDVNLAGFTLTPFVGVSVFY